KRTTVRHILPATRESRDVEVVFLKNDGADDTGIAVDTGTEHQSSGATFGHVDIDIHKAWGRAGTTESVPEGIALRRRPVHVVLRIGKAVGVNALSPHSGRRSRPQRIATLG